MLAIVLDVNRESQSRCTINEALSLCILRSAFRTGRCSSNAFCSVKAVLVESATPSTPDSENVRVACHQQQPQCPSLPLNHDLDLFKVLCLEQQPKPARSMEHVVAVPKLRHLCVDLADQKATAGHGAVEIHDELVVYLSVAGLGPLLDPDEGCAESRELALKGQDGEVGISPLATEIVDAAKGLAKDIDDVGKGASGAQYSAWVHGNVVGVWAGLEHRLGSRVEKKDGDRLDLADL